MTTLTESRVQLEVECSACGKAYRLPGRHAGKRFRCKACGEPVETPSVGGPDVEPASRPERKRGEKKKKKKGLSQRRNDATNGEDEEERGGPLRQRRSRRRTGSPREARPKKPSFFDSWAGIGLGFVGIIAVIAVMGFWFKGKSDSLRKEGLRAITSGVTDAEERAIKQVIVQHVHNRAVYLATPTDLRGRKQHARVGKSDYLAELKALVTAHWRDLQALETPTGPTLEGYWENRTADSHTIVRLDAAGTYGQGWFTGSNPTPFETATGRWTLDAGGSGMTWNPTTEPDPNPFVRYTIKAFVLREMDGQLSYWRRTTGTPDLVAAIPE